MTNGFTEAWLREHQAKMRGQHIERHPSVISPDQIAFTLSKPTPSLNVVLNQQWPARRRYAKRISNEIGLIFKDRLLENPMQRAIVRITRYAVALCDHDNAVGGTKALCDALIVKSDRHPFGLGFIADDDDAHLVRDIRQVAVARKRDERTEVVIERLT